MKTTKRTKVLHVVGSMNRAGTETMLMNIFRHMNKERVQFDFISYGQEKAHYDDEIECLGGKVIKLNQTNSIKQLYQAMKRYGPYDIVHAHTLFHCGLALFAAFLAGVKIRIAHAHTTSDKSDRLSRKVYIKGMRTLVNIFSTKRLACSDGAGAYLFGKNDAARKKYRFFPNVVDHTRFINSAKKDVQSFKMQYGLGNRIVIGHIGTFKEAKNHQFILKVTKNLIKLDSMIKVLLIGTGELEGLIKGIAKREGLLDHISFLGVREDIPTMLHSMDVFILPSTYEGLGLVLLEAQACGVPCVVSEAIQPEADIGLGLIHPLDLVDNPSIWAKKILKLANEKKKNANEIHDAFELSGYSLESCLAKLMDIYDIRSKEVQKSEQSFNYFI